MSLPRVSVLIRSYHNDFNWLVYCLESVRQHLKDWFEIVVVIPKGSVRYLAATSLNHYLHNEKGRSLATLKIIPDEPNGYINQQVTKLNADFYCTATDYVMHVDSDCVFTQDCSIYNWVPDHKPILWHDPFDKLETPWKHPTEKALGFECHNETMRCLPIVYPHWIYKKVREHIKSVHGIPCKKYVMSQLHFSEFNVIGNYALKFHPESFTINSPAMEYTKKLLRQFWSYSKLNQEDLAEIVQYISLEEMTNYQRNGLKALSF